MPTIGDKEFPATNIDTAVDSAKKIAKQFKGVPFDRKSLASALQYKSETTGAFNQLLADLRKFGLVTGRGESLQATDLVEKLAVPHDEKEYSGAVVEAMNNVPLFRELYDHYRGAVPSEDELLTMLINISKANRVDVADTVGRIRGNLSSGWAKAGGYRPANLEAPRHDDRQANKEVPSDMITFSAGKMQMSYELSKEGIELMRANFTDDFWRILAKQIAAKSEAKDGQP
jgi:hypothetical protein